VAAQILGLGALNSANSAQIIEPSPGICAVIGGAGITEVCFSLQRKFTSSLRRSISLELLPDKY